MESTAGESCRGWEGERGIIPKSNKRIMEILVHKIASMRLAPQYQYVQQQQQQRRPTHIWMLRAAVWACQLGGGSERAVSSECAGKSVAKWAFKECNRCTHAVSVRAEPAEYLPDGYHGTHTHTYTYEHTHTVNEMQLQPKNVIIWHICTLCLPFSCSLPFFLLLLLLPLKPCLLFEYRAQGSLFSWPRATSTEKLVWFPLSLAIAPQADCLSAIKLDNCLRKMKREREGRESAFCKLFMFKIKA